MMHSGLQSRSPPNVLQTSFTSDTGHTQLSQNYGSLSELTDFLQKLQLSVLKALTSFEWTQKCC